MNNPFVPMEASLAMAYVPWQPWGELYNEKTALERGTAFACLYMPFMGRRGSTCM